jgi:hypothetical protein
LFTVFRNGLQVVITPDLSFKFLSVLITHHCGISQAKSSKMARRGYAADFHALIHPHSGHFSILRP